MQSKENLTQEHIENGKQTNFFYKYVSEYVKTNITNDIELCHDRINHIIKYGVKKYEDFELLGVLSFLMGLDYSGQIYPQKAIVTTANNRFKELNIPENLIERFCDWVNCFTIEDSEEFRQILSDFVQSRKNKYKQTINLDTKQNFELKNLRAKINTFINNGTFPIAYSKPIKQIKKDDYTYENILQLNTLLQENGTFKGSVVHKLVDVYGDELFKYVLIKSTEVYNDIKYSLLYEEAIISLLETSLRFTVFINPDKYTLVEYEQFKIRKDIGEQKQEEKQEEIVGEFEPDNYECFDSMKKYSNDELMDIMNNNPDLFIEINLKDIAKRELTGMHASSVIDRINMLCDSDDLVQHVYGYMKRMLNHENRTYQLFNDQYTATVLSNIDIVLDEMKTKYKNNVETVCSSIEQKQQTTIVSMINEVISNCILETQEQKQYLVSQLIENSIETWNHFQQILSVIETCKITGDSVTLYTNLVDYVEDKVDIKNIFDISNSLSKQELKISVFKAFKDWYTQPKN